MKKKTVNKLKKRDKKRNPNRMRVDDSGRRLALILKRGRELARRELADRRVVERVDESGLHANLKDMVQRRKLHQEDLDEYLKRR
jgi:hypothetical protein